MWISKWGLSRIAKTSTRFHPGINLADFALFFRQRCCLL
ncbi:hypothetical protein BN2497_4255 [Janthinobacterium sp. CG23_2]|nr:hypothetical protein BN2497_4255 [Janthinobacterium sp. CG23_2]CUU28525.1 hypothetical protein BN3177_4255 [Janthinobacterium sp. CG23_2]